MPPVTDDGSPLLFQLVARCPTLDDATSTMDYLVCQGVRRLALAVLDHGKPSSADSFYVVADEADARRARQLLRSGADVRVGTLGARATPCVGSVPARSAHPSSGGGGGRWRRRSRPDSGGR